MGAVLYALGALNDRGQLTKLGRRMAEFPMDPQLSKTLIEAEKFGVVEEVVTGTRRPFFFVVVVVVVLCLRPMLLLHSLMRRDW